MADAGPLYMGFDLSTQQLKGIVVSSDLKLVHEAKVDFDADLANSHYGVKNGVFTIPDKHEIFAPVAMWVEAVDLVLQRLKKSGLDFSRVQGVSGAGMQHGTVFWNHDAERALQALDAGKTLVEQLGGDADNKTNGVFSHPYSPNWQDASTQKECDAFDAELGSPEELAQVTGSKAHHRFSGPQILRFHTKHPSAYKQTARVSLVSSFLASIFLGRIAPIDISDVTGMNFWDIKAECWHEKLLALAAGNQGVADLKAKLGDVQRDGGKAVGQISNYLVKRWGFPKDCQIVPFTGDNPATILALPLRASDAIVSLGTSTTFLMSTRQYKPDPAYHFMNHPTTPGLFMFMLCYKNGSLAREKVRDFVNSSISTSGSTENKSWDHFNTEALRVAPMEYHDAGKGSKQMRMGLWFPLQEIVPNVRAGEWRYIYNPATKTINPEDETLSESFYDPRGIIESQMLSLRLRSAGLVSEEKNAAGNVLPPQPRRVYLVGGGSANEAIAKICGEVLGSVEGVYRLDIGGNACALGAAYKAVWGCERASSETFEDLIGKRWDEAGFVKRVADGYQEGIFERYGEALEGFAMMEEEVLRIEKGGKKRGEKKGEEDGDQDEGIAAGVTGEPDRKRSKTQQGE
ncbi:putative D-Xylulose kinase [Cryomyces antarcticus]|uniref:Xylulose kinase n=1 Tax=Cryomyces antarcticus TaxID=329879 RepID=A0ABR0LZT2_9PEZI|nr:hypothetical protein LTR39_000680 [Cryomyces antarcticus]KAK5020463.1 hypothetical protein LTR60_000493 [Cryomyces antarcticus]KAK5257291.1 hypothetical protein LTR16_001076 [Cryomyces antarcticus]